MKEKLISLFWSVRNFPNALRHRVFKHGFWYCVARRVPRALRYHVIIMCTADYSVAFPTTHVPSQKAMDVAKWLER